MNLNFIIELDTLTKKPLHILNASAGSGKTYHLVKEYIKLLIHDSDHTTSFSSIIAMTFTNKAALEMKERIIKALDEISSPEAHKHVADHLTQQIANELATSAPEVEKRCKIALKHILHQYEDFHVMTIDKFNLRLIKSFGRDLDLPQDFEVILDETEIIESIVDDLLNQLGDEGSKNLSQLLFNYARANLDEGLSWNFRRSLINFGRVLRSERDSQTVQRLMTMDLSIDTYKWLQAQRAQVNRKFDQLKDKVTKEFEVHAGDPKSLPGGGHTVSDIKSILKKESFPIDSALIKKRLEGNLDIEKDGKLVPLPLKQALLDLNNYWESAIQEFAGVHLFLNNFFNMALLQYMANSLESIKQEEKIIRISEFNTLISTLIQEENTPFIYERLGTRYKHFLLDEFQDTSHLQWLNLVPLIHESISHNHENLIVGDPKQSIYRFKNGVAEQFVELPSIYNPENNPSIAQKSHYFKQMGKVEELTNNWRSSATIVNFNNTFFERFKTLLPEDSVEFYNSIEQQPMASKNGKISIYSRPLDKEEKYASIDLLPKIIEWIEECKSDGFAPSDICILGGRNKECNAWALGLNDAGYRVVSTDSLLIHSDLYVQLSIAYLEWRLRPSGENEKKRFAELFFRVNADSYEDYKAFIKERTTENDRTYRYFDENDFLDKHFNGYTSFFFKYENLYDLIQGFYRLTGFAELDNPYLHHLADIIFKFSLKRGPDLKVFLDEYHRKKDDIAVQVPEADDAINIMTIHKSKGLEFPVVLIPTLNFSLDIKSSFLVDVDDFIVYKSPSANEILKPLIELREKELNQIITDFVNLIYVGMTRPVERLYLQNEFESKKFGALFHQALEQSDLATVEDTTLYVDLNDGVRSQPKEKQQRDLLQPHDASDYLWFPDIAFQDNEELNTEDLLSNERQFGIQFHLLISRISSKEQIEIELQRAIKGDEVQKENEHVLRERLQDLFSLEAYSELLRNKTDVLNEQSILVDENTVVRPDKIILKENETIVIDFKTGIPSDKDQKQVNQYKFVLLEMGYPNVSCYLYYSTIHELRQVG